MCITVNTAELSKTKILSIALESGNHFIAYSNSVQNLSGKPNAMILPIPGRTSPEMFHNTENYKDFMDEIIKESTMDKYYGAESRGFRSKGMEILSFDQFELGMYTVGLAVGFSGIREFINQLPEAKRPEISEDLKEFFEEKYEGWSFAVCVFDSNKAVDAQPIAFEYEPFNYSLIYFPTMDAHDGGAPRLEAMVHMDHTFIYQHIGKLNRQLYKSHVTLKAAVPSFLNDRRYRTIEVKGVERNGDTFVQNVLMREIDFEQEPAFKKVSPVPYTVEA